MNQVAFDDLRWLNLLWVVLVLALVGLYGLWQQRRALQIFAELRLVQRLAPRFGWARRFIRLALVLVGLTALVGAIIGPRWGEREQRVSRRGIDVMILLDVSRSM